MQSIADDDVATAPDIATLDALYRETDRLELTPGWVPRETPILWREPKTEFLPAHWRWAECRDALDAAGRLIDVSLAERRNLVLRNPMPGNNFATARTLVCAYQMILPGEAAPSHRHAPHALRLIIEAEGAFSIVDGEKTPMETGDVVLTPGWSWHSHGHDGDAPAYWFDGLDVPLTHLLEPMFYEEHPDRFEKNVVVVAESPYRFPRESIERALDKAAPDPEGCNGRRVILDAPSMPTMGIAMQRLDAGSETRRFRSTANRVFCVAEGSGTTTTRGRRIPWQRGDTFVVPSWYGHSHDAESDAVLFELSDEPLMRWAKYYRVALD